MAENPFLFPVSNAYHIIMVPQPDGTFMAYFAEAPTSFAYGETKGKAFAELLRLGQFSGSDDSESEAR
ncbi:MAG: hypothetical protein AB1846_16875 [Chloroflexota bacterium]